MRHELRVFIPRTVYEIHLNMRDQTLQTDLNLGGVGRSLRIRIHNLFFGIPRHREFLASRDTGCQFLVGSHGCSQAFLAKFQKIILGQFAEWTAPVGDGIYLIGSAQYPLAVAIGCYRSGQCICAGSPICAARRAGLEISGQVNDHFPAFSREHYEHQLADFTLIIIDTSGHRHIAPASEIHHDIKRGWETRFHSSSEILLPASRQKRGANERRNVECLSHNAHHSNVM